jgi:hypothetical protein
MVGHIQFGLFLVLVVLAHHQIHHQIHDVNHVVDLFFDIQSMYFIYDNYENNFYLNCCYYGYYFFFYCFIIID